MNVIYLAGGCFWGMEELFRSQPGVTNTEVGYTGGTHEHPTYENHPGHAEAIAVTYDEQQTSYEELLGFFFRIHDPTTLNQQGNDIGISYRSAIFYQTLTEKRIAEQVIAGINAASFWPKPIITTLEKFKQFWSAEPYHQDYLQKNPGGYTCHYIRS